MNGFNLLEASDIKLGGSTITALYYGLTKLWPTGIDYSREYLTIESLEDNNTIGFKTRNTSLLKTIQVSTDKNNWTSYTSSTGGTTLATLNTGDKLYVKGSNSYYATSPYYNHFTSSGQFNVFGNIMSLIYGDNFIGQTALTDNYTFRNLFYNSNVVDASNLILPAKTLTEDCYSSMFSDCTSLTTAPSVLPAPTLASNCYISMFSGCTSLTTAPVLPATTLAESCYISMFEDCTNLTTAPELPATTLADCCYNDMFYGCSSLTTAPVLPATILVLGCYEAMFTDCTSLNYIKMLATDISATGCLDDWVYGVASTGTFVKEYGANIPINSTSGIPTGWTVQEINPAEEYLTFKILSDGNIYWRSNGSISKTIEYSLNDGAWTSITSSTTPTAIPVVTNDIVRFRGTNTQYATQNTNFCGFGQGNAGTSGESYDNDAAEFEVRGNIMSLIYGDNFASQSSLSDTYNFCSLFKKAKVVSAKNLILPATTLTQYCYRAMFSYCTYLTTAPELPATTLAKGVYWYMFEHCSITTPPTLPATTLVDECYGHMFRGCANLTSVPALPATTMKPSCYRYMFGECTSLTTAPVLPATTLADRCYSEMFKGCTSLTTIPSTLPATTLASNCYGSMFSGCTSLTTAPILPALTLVNNCYQYMFNSCSSLNYIKMLATSITASNCLKTWVGNVSPTGTFVKNASATWTTTGTSGIPTGWTVQTASS